MHSSLKLTGSWRHSEKTPTVMLDGDITIVEKVKPVD